MKGETGPASEIVLSGPSGLAALAPGFFGCRSTNHVDDRHKDEPCFSHV